MHSEWTNLISAIRSCSGQGIGQHSLVTFLLVMQWHGGGTVKTAAHLRYPMELPIGKFSTKEAVADGWASTYRLGGVVLHHGNSANAGHYTIVSRQPNGSWLEFNDDHVPEPETAAQVLSHHQLVCGLIYYRLPPR